LENFLSRWQSFFVTEFSRRASHALAVDSGGGVRQHDGPCATFLNLFTKAKALCL
jgi:hypothetical protein